jgi:2-C-methyl-D-erythritol 4-phosphate cytidylyltransferase
MTYYALVPAAGAGTRMNAESASVLPKQYLQLAGRPMIWHALATLCSVPEIAHVFVVIAPDDDQWPEDVMKELEGQITVFKCGGHDRTESVTNGLREMARELDGNLNESADWILVHDAARPCLTKEHVAQLIAEIGADETGGLLAVPVADTLKRAQATIEGGSRSVETIARSGMWQAQTPQMFRYAMLLSALELAAAVTDEASAIEATGRAPRLVAGDLTNLKVTYPDDLQLAEWIIQYRASQK